MKTLFEGAGEKTKTKLYSSFATEQQKAKILNEEIIEDWKMFLKNQN